MNRVLAIPDLHAPFTDIDCLSFYYAVATAFKPNVIIQLGDAYDMFCFSKFPRSHNVIKPKDELNQGFELLRNFWKNMRSCAPDARLIQISGNHEARISKRVEEALPALESFVESGIKALYKFPFVEAHMDPKDEIEIDGILYVHGWLTNLGAHMRYFNQSVVHGHTHRGGLAVENRHQGYIFELDCGYGADDRSRPLKYGSTRTNKWTKGLGMIDEYGPRFVFRP